MADIVDSHVVFDNLSTKFSHLLYGRTKSDRNLINETLDELNKLDFRYPIVKNVTKAVLLVNQCCTVIPPDDPLLTAKCCSLITNLVNRQHVQISGRTLTLTLQWCLHALKQSEHVVIAEVLIAINALLRSNVQNLHSVVHEVVNTSSPVVLLAQKETVIEVVVLAVQCLEICTIMPDEIKEKNENFFHLELCTKIFLKYLLSENVDISCSLLHCKLLTSCLKGLHNIIIQQQNYLNDNLGVLLGIAKSYMVYGIKGVSFMKPQKLMPSALSIPESTVSVTEKKGGKMIKQRKHRTSASNKKDLKKTDVSNWSEDQFWSYVPATANIALIGDLVPNSYSYGSKLKTSDSDFSDSECDKIAKLGIVQGRVRQAALGLLLNLVKYTDKKIIFSYWSSFVPDGSPSGQHNLTICILKDPSTKGRMAALNVLLALLSSSKLYLAQAEHSESHTSFTPFSAVLGAMIQELHHCLRLALNENSAHVLTQALKCFAGLVQATPYHRLTPGILTKVIRSVKVCTSHKDASVQVTALIVLGCIIASEPTIPETKEAFLKNLTKMQSEKKLAEQNSSLSSSLELNYTEISSDDDDDIQQARSQQKVDFPWLLEKCLRNLGINTQSEKSENPIPLPVKLESLQVISAMTRNYFTSLMAPYLRLISKALEASLLDKYADLRLHAGRTVDFIGQAMNQYFANNSEECTLTIKEGLSFWTNLINEPLLALIQNEENATLRAVGCDCLGSIGPNIFESLPREKQILIITSLLNSSRDEENSVKGAAVRALAISVLYPSLREDPGFVIDAAESIYRTLQDNNMTVRIKSSWSLGNLSDALALNRNDVNVIEEIPDTLLLKLIEAGIKGSNDNDKIRTNAVRALGNLLLLITTDLIADTRFRSHIEQSIDILVKNAATSPNMKVRWNACYALGNVLKNATLYEGCNGWQNSVFITLSDLVIGYHNFKVRINAALALSCPAIRAHYGQYYYTIWNSLLKALENSENIDDFREFKHRDNLIEQICISIGHLTKLMLVEDLNALNESFTFYLDTLKVHMRKVSERLVPEKTESLFTAATHIQSLALKDLTNEQRKTVNCFKEIFNNNC